MTVNFYLNKTSSKSEKYTIFCHVYYAGKQFVVSTGERLELKYWDKTKKQVRRSYTGSPELNEFLKKFKLAIESHIRQLRSENPFVDYETLKESVKKEVKGSHANDLYEALDKFCSFIKNERTKATLTKYNTLRKQLKDFQTKTAKPKIYL